MVLPRRAAPTVLLAFLLTAGCLGGGTPEGPTTGLDTGGSVREAQTDAPPTAGITNQTGAVQGFVASDAGARLDGAFVALLGSGHSVATNKTGAFALSGVQPGRHTIRVDSQGFLSLERDINVTAGKVTHLEITLVPAVAGAAGYVPHLHDHWGERTRVTIYEDTHRFTWRTVAEGGEAIYATCTRTPVNFTTEYCWYIPLPLADDTLVWQGTDRLEILVKWENQDQIPQIGFEFQTADNAKWTNKPVRNGELLTVPLTPENADHGHQRYTAWALRLNIEPTYAGQKLSNPTLNDRALGAIHVKVEGVKGIVPAEPAHRNYWGHGDTRTLVDGAITNVLGLPKTRTGTETFCNATSICWLLPAGQVVPPGTTRLDVTLEYRAKTPALEPTMTKKTLAFRTAAVRPATATLDDLRVDQPTENPWGRTVYSMAIQPHEADAFYQAKSNWMFLLANEGEEQSDTFYEDCWNYVAGCGGSEYILTVSAVNENWTPELADSTAEA